MTFKKGQSGNPNGRPPISELGELRDALAKVKEKEGKSFLESFVERSYKDNNIAVALAKKILPDMTYNKNDDTLNMILMPFIKKDGEEVRENVGS